MGHRKLLTKGYIIMAHLYGATGTEGANPLPPVSIYIYIYTYTHENSVFMHCDQLYCKLICTGVL